MKFNKLMASVAVAAAFAGVAPVASAAQIDIPLYGIRNAGTPSATDTYSFNLTPSGSGEIAVIFNSNLSASYALYAGNTASGPVLASGALPSGTSLNLSLGSSLTGDYTLAIAASLLPSQPAGFYTGAITLSTVPEAGELLMMSAGLATLAAFVRRRKARAATAVAC